MATLDEILERYAAADTVGVEAEVTQAVRTAYDARDSDETWKDFVQSITGPTPMALVAADRAVAHSEFDLALECYASLVRRAGAEVPDLAQAGRVLLRRAAAPLEPIPSESCDTDSCPDVDLGFPVCDGVELPEKYAGRLFSLSTEAFSRALRLLRANWEFEESDSIHDEIEYLFHDLLALDGLRCSLLLMDDVESLNIVLQEIDRALGDGLGLDVEGRVAIRAAETRGWLRGSRGRPFWSGVDEQGKDHAEHDATEARLALWQHSEILSLLRGLTPDIKRAVRAELDHVDWQRDTARTHLIEEFADRWSGLPSSVQRQIEQAERLRPIFAGLDGIDWAPIIMQYGRALELLLHDRLRDSLIASIDRGSTKKSPEARTADLLRLTEESRFWTAGDFSVGIQKVAGSLANAEGARRLSKSLRDFAGDFRNPAAHAGAFVDPAFVRDAREALLGQAGLLWRVQAFRM